MKCERVKFLLSPYQDNELAPEIRQKVDAHLNQCQQCLKELKDLNMIHQEVKGLEEKPLDAKFTETVMKRISQSRQKRYRFSPSLVYVATFIFFLVIGLSLNLFNGRKNGNNTHIQTLSNLLVHSQQLSLIHIQDDTVAMLSQEVKNE